MKVTDLRCSICGSDARDVDLGVEWDASTAVYWTCLNGHAEISGWRPSISGLSSALSDPRLYPAPMGAADAMAGLDSKARNEFLDMMSGRIAKAASDQADRMAKELYYTPPVFMGREWPKPSHWVWRTKLRWWWLEVREWIAVKVLRVDLRDDYDE